MLPMEIIDLHKFEREEGISSPLSVALGNFDGVHIGHAALISRAVEYAKEHGIKSAVWTFADESAVLPNKPGVRCITTMREKLELFKALGVDFVLLEEFSRVRDYSPEKFVQELLVGQCNAACTVCGFNFRFGKGGVGDSDTLQKLMSPRDTVIVPPVYVGGQIVSSTLVRERIENGDMESVAALLGRNFSVDLPVVEGKRLGRTIGVPTINQNFAPGQVIPKGGVYACLVDIDGTEHIGVANVGIRPTIKEDTHFVNCETHIVDYEGELYGKNVKVRFCLRLRDEMRFSHVDALGAQARCDIESAKEYFKSKQRTI